MYECVGDEMLETGIIVRRITPARMNSIRYIVEEEEAFGCKVLHDIVHHEHVLVLDEVGSNTNQKGGGNVGGELIMCKQGKTSQRKINTQDNTLHSAGTYLTGR